MNRAGERIRVLRVLARMNVGGPALHVSILSGRLDPDRYETLLVAGRLGPGEASAEYLAERYGARLVKVDSLGPELSPRDDLSALRALRQVERAFRPHIVHTHTAKAGLAGRLTATIARPRPIIVHTYHGHVLSGYFGPAKERLFRFLERSMARRSEALVGVSAATVDDLVRLGIAPRERFVTIPLGLELDPFLTSTRADGAAVRAELGLAEDEVLLTSVGRLVPIKRLDVLIEAFAAFRSAGGNAVLAIVGDGEERAALEARAQRLQLGGAVRFLGYRRDLREVHAATDIAVLSSDNEGTPVALIEAAASGRPSVATDVGGVCDVVASGCGIVVPPGDPVRYSRALEDLAGNHARRAEMGRAAREHVRVRFGAERLLDDIDALYRRLLSDGRRSA